MQLLKKPTMAKPVIIRQDDEIMETIEITTRREIGVVAEEIIQT